MEDHIREKCQFCPLPCPHMCGTLTIRKMDLQDHLNTCERLPVKCSNNCEAIIPREMITNHIKDDCRLTKIPCPYSRMGCSTEVQRDQLESHLQHETKRHLDLACSELKKKTIQLDRLEATQKTVQNNHDRLEKRVEETVDVLQQQHQNRVNVLQQEYEEKLRILKQNVNATQTKLEQKLSTERKIFLVCLLLSLVCLVSYLTKIEKEVQNNLEESVSDTQSLIRNDLERKVNSLNSRLRVTEESRIFTWKITSFAVKLKQAKEYSREYIQIGSDPFHVYGYQLRLRLYPNGFGNGENTHLSVSITVMKGEYDAILPWPFKKKVKFTLIDQQEDPAKRENVVGQFTPGSTQECFARPTQEENSKGNGLSQFISHEKLHSRRYLVDDTLFIQVEVGPFQQLFN